MPEFKLIEKLLYKSEQNDIEAEFIIGNETLWSSQKVIAEIFGTTSANISMHFSNIIQEEELDEKEVNISSKDLFKDHPNFIKKSLKKSNNQEKPQKWYNLDATISIRYRINSKEATQFRCWANKILKEYMIKWFVINKELLKKGGIFTEDYFDELETIREIRGSKRRFNQKITDIYATSFDYNKDADITKEFFVTVDNVDNMRVNMYNY